MGEQLRAVGARTGQMEVQESSVTCLAAKLPGRGCRRPTLAASSVVGNYGRDADLNEVLGPNNSLLPGIFTAEVVPIGR